MFNFTVGCGTYNIIQSVSANLNLVSRLEWIYKVLDEQRRTIELTGVDPEDVVVLAKHHGACACPSRYETTTKSSVYLEINTSLVVVLLQLGN